jgi:hypothetical protein
MMEKRSEEIFEKKMVKWKKKKKIDGKKMMNKNH